MNRERWNKICFLLSENIKSSISESAFEQKVIQALSVLGWEEFHGLLEIRPSFPIGASNRITPDFVVKSETNEKLFVIEIKQPTISITSGFQQQLFSYMRQLRLDFGILIGQEIQVFYDGVKIPHDEPILLDRISFERNSISGEKFVELFSRDNYNKDQLEAFVDNYKQNLIREKDVEQLTQELLSEDYELHLVDLLRDELSKKYETDVITTVLDKFEINIAQKYREVPVSEDYHPIIVAETQILNNHILKSHNKSVSEFTVELSNKYITDDRQKEIFLQDGVWMKVRLNYIGGLILSKRGKTIFSPKDIRDVVREELIPSLKEIDDGQLSGMLLTQDVHFNTVSPKWHNGYPCLENVGRGQYRFLGFKPTHYQQSQKEPSISKVCEQATFEINNTKYALKRFENNMIRIFTSNNEMLDTQVKPVLREIIDNYHLDISLKLKSGVLKNTQILGKDVIKALKSITQ